MQKKFRIFTVAMVLLLGVFALTAFVSCDKKPVENVTITISVDEIQLEVGQTQKLTVSIEPYDAVDKTIQWKSSDNKIATVENGTVTAVAEGEVTITVTSNQKSDTCKVIVTAAGETPDTDEKPETPDGGTDEKPDGAENKTRNKA